MSYKPWQHKFYLSPVKPDDVRLHDTLLALSEKDQAGAWIRKALLAALDSGDMGTYRDSVLHGDMSLYSTTKESVDAPETAPLDKPATPKGTVFQQSAAKPIPGFIGRKTE